MIEENKIPKHWQVKKLGEVCNVLDNLRKPINSSERQKRISGKKKNELFPYYGATGQVGFIDEYITDGEFILVGEDGAPFLDFFKDKAYKITGRTWVNNHAHILNGKENILLNDFLLYYLNSINYGQFVNGTTRLKLTKSSLVDIPFVLPPIKEQEAIVSKIEELLSDLENGKQQLKIAQQQLNLYRQSLLKWAFEGRLTNKNVNGELPKKWKLISLGEVVEIKRGKSKHRPRNEPSLFGGKYPFVQTGEIRNANGGTINSFTQTYNEKGLAQSKLWKKGTLCITIAANIGETAFLGMDACFPDSIVGIISDENFILPKYTNYFLVSFKSKLEGLAPATAQKNVNVDILQKIKIPLAPIQEQQNIIDEIESKLTVCDKIEETISQSLQQAEMLRQSILKKAFEGKLVAVAEIKAAKQQEAKVIPLTSIAFPKTISGIAATDLQAGIISMVIDLHQNNPKHSDKLNHVKCEKISDLVERKLGISLGRVAMKDAAGPDDYPHLKKVEHRANKAGLFRAVALQPIGHTYQPMRNMQKAIEKTKTVLSAEELKQIDDLLKVFLPFELEHAELVATLFAGWNNLLLLSKNPTDEEIVFESRENWSTRKLTIEREKFFKTLSWMKQHNYIPEGKGQLVLKKEEVKKVKVSKKKKGNEK